MLLERFREAKRSEIASLRRAAEHGELPAVYAGSRPDFMAALQTARRETMPAVVAEYKRASPSRGVICDALEVEDVVRQYASVGAAAVSILTEETFFQGRLAYLERAAKKELYKGPRLPLLRKDFLFDPLQVRYTASTPASALLLIVRLTPKVEVLRALRESTEAHGMQAVVEVFDADDLRLARESGARIIQVNARDLENLSVHRDACLVLARDNPPERGEIWIAASGIRSSAHMREAADAGFHAVLVGSALMEGGQPAAALSALLA